MDGLTTKNINTKQQLLSEVLSGLNSTHFILKGALNLKGALRGL